MSDFSIREYNTADIDQLSRIWSDNFGDGPRFIADFFRMLPEMGTGVVAELEGRIVGSAYVLCGQKLILDHKEAFTDDASAPVCGYIYAVSVDESYRHYGIGAALTRAAAEKGKELGADIISILPAEESLYKWYEDIIGVKCVLRRKKEIVESSVLERCTPISAGEYMMWRENLLKDLPHLHLSAPSLEFERMLCADNGGGFYASGCGIAAAYNNSGVGVIIELICTDDCERRIVAASIGAAMGVEKVVIYSPSVDGEPYIAADTDIIPENCVWSFSYD